MGKVDITNKYITIQGWMRTELGLKENELLLYALIYGFSQDEESKFTGSQSYMSEWVGISTRKIRDRLNSLLNKQLIEKTEKYVNGMKFCEYKATPLNRDTERSEGRTKGPWGGVEKSAGGTDERSDNNININNKDNNIDLPPIVPQTDFEIIDCVVEKDYEFADVEIVDDLDFENVWKMYGEHGNKYLAQCEYKLIRLEDKRKVIQHIPEYNKSISDIRYKKKFENYLKSKEYNVKPINRNNNGPRTTKQSSLTDKDIFDIVSRAYSDDL